MRWLVANFRDLKKNVAIHILLNKVDVALGGSPHNADAEKLIAGQLALVEEHAKNVLGDFFPRVTGITPISMEDDYLFSKYFTLALKAVADRWKK